MGQLAASVGLGLALTFSVGIEAHCQSAGDGGPAHANNARGQILLVLPFDNRSGQPSLEWIREAAPEILSARFTSAGFAPMSRPDRLYALDHLGLPQGFQPSRASSLKLAETLDADWIVVGNYVTDGPAILAEARLVDVPHLHMGEAVTARGEMRDMSAVFGSLAWKLTRQLDPRFSVAEETFVAASKGLRLDAFEQYIRGITEPDQQERLQHLKQAVTLGPGMGQAWMALGREEYNSQQYQSAAQAFARVGSSDPDALEAGFYRGLSLLFSGDYPRAEDAFRNVAAVLPLPEVVNNQGVALSRRGKDAGALFRQAIAADPSVADYHFNLAVTLHKKGDAAEALTELAQCLHLRPNDEEAQDLQEAWKASSEAGEVATKVDPLQRIVRTFDAVAFRQAAQMIDQVETAKLTALSPHERAQRLAAQARDFLSHGLLLEAERASLSAVADDAKLPEAHASLAEVRERTGDFAAARREATTSLELLPSVNAYLVLGRLDFAANHLDQANDETESALRIDATNKQAIELKRQIVGKDASKK